MVKQSSPGIRAADSRWLPLALLVLSAADVFVVVFPIEGLAVAAILRKPRQWLRYCLALAIGTTLGCWVLAGLAYRHSGWVLGHLGSLVDSPAWSWIQHQLQTRTGDWAGGLLVLMGTFSPVPIQVLVLGPALAGLSPAVLYVALGTGRLTRALLLGWAASRAPGLLSRFGKAREELKSLE